MYGSTADNGLKKTEWTQVLSSFNTSMQSNYTKSQLQSQLQQLKSKYLIFKEIVGNSGFGWDPVTKIPTARDDVWVRYLSAHPKAREFRNTTLPLGICSFFFDFSTSMMMMKTKRRMIAHSMMFLACEFVS